MKEKFIKFWEQDSDTIIYTIMCYMTLPAIVFGFLYMWAAQYLPEELGVCGFKKVTGMYCPGCGGTRAFKALFRLDILAALIYHTPAVYGVWLYITYFVSQTLMRISKGRIKGMELKAGYLYAMLILVVLNFVIRNILLVGFQIDTLPLELSFF